MSETVTPAAAEALQRRIKMLRKDAPFQSYLRAREAVLRMQTLAAQESSAYWEEELAGFEYLMDASPLLIARLREHTFHVTGLKTYDYRSGKDANRARAAEKLRMLSDVAGDRSLLVPEAPELGGFGFEIDGARYNVDTLKFFEVMIALNLGAVLPKLQEPGDRRAVWEIGAGWGGFARVWKTLIPNTTYFIVDLPELFLFSGTYLQTVFPDATIRYWQGESADDLMDGWENVDFVMVPAGALDAFRPPRLDLAINMVSFQEMTTAQVRGYVEHAHALGAPFLYSLNRDRSLYNTELTSTRAIIAERYRLHEIPVLGIPYTKMPKMSGASGVMQRALRTVRDENANEYRHGVGWRRP
jgi:putative sugar O-methyltransferase